MAYLGLSRACELDCCVRSLRLMSMLIQIVVYTKSLNLGAIYIQTPFPGVGLCNPRSRIPMVCYISIEIHPHHGLLPLRRMDKPLIHPPSSIHRPWAMQSIVAGRGFYPAFSTKPNPGAHRTRPIRTEGFRLYADLRGHDQNRFGPHEDAILVCPGIESGRSRLCCLRQNLRCWPVDSAVP